MNTNLQAFDIQTPNIRRIDVLPKGIPRDAWQKFRSDNVWSTAKVAMHGENAYIVLSAHSTLKLSRIIFEIPDFISQSWCAINDALLKFSDDGCTMTYPFGRNFDDCLSWLCQKHGMRAGYVVSITKPMK